MKEQGEMMTEGVPQEQNPAVPAAGDAPAMERGLTAEPPPEPQEAETDEEEQEDPAAGRVLPGEAYPEDAEDEEWEFEEDASEDEAVEAALPLPLPQEAEAPSAAFVVSATPVAAPASLLSPADAAKQRYWSRVLTGSAETVPDEVRERAGLANGVLTDEEREYRLLSVINRSWAVDNLGLSRERVRSEWRGLRRQLAERFRVADDEQELFAALSVEAKVAPRRERMKALCQEHYLAALFGRELPLPEYEESADGEEVPQARSFAYAAQQRGAELRRSCLPLAAEVAEGLDAFAALEEDAVAAPRVLAASPELARSLEALAGLDERTRRLVYAIAQEEFRSRHAEKKGESFLRTVMRATRRGATGLGFGLGQALAHTTAATMDSLGNALGKEAGQALHAGAKALDLRARIAEELRQLLYHEVNPLQVSEDAGFAGQLLVDAAGATPSAVAAACGGAGFAVLGLSGAGEAVAAARARAPEGSQWLQYLAGIVGGGIQASIYSGMSRVGGQILSNAIGRFARASGTGAGGYTLASLGVLAATGLEEAKLLFAAKAADAAGLGAQELAARLDRTASNIDWKAYGDNAQDVELNLREAAMTLPFILIGSGRVALRHFRSRDAVLGDGYALREWGIDEATREAIMKEGDINRQGDMLREALRGSRRWSAPGFVAEAMRALRLLNTDYFQGFKDKRAVVDFLKLPSQGEQLPRPALEPLSAENPEHARLLQERHGSMEKVNRSRLWLAMQLRDEWLQKAHLVDEAAAEKGQMLPTSARRRFYAEELSPPEALVPPYLRPSGAYRPQAEAVRAALLRDRVAELHDLSYQLLLSAFPLDALSHSTRGLNHLRQAAEASRRTLLEAVGRSVLRRATGASAEEAWGELGQVVSDYFKRRRYSSFPPAWMSRVPTLTTRRLDEYARATAGEELAEAPAELRDAFRVALGLRSCAAALYELLPMSPDFRTALSRGFTPAKAYVHLLSRELGVPMADLPQVQEMLNTFSKRATDMRAFRLHNEEDFEAYSRLSGYEFESAQAEGAGRELWRVRRPNGRFTPWHRRRSDAVNDVVANAALIFLPFSGDPVEPFRVLDPSRPYDLNAVGREHTPQFTGYDNLCRVALRDTARSWVETAPYAQPGFELGTLRRYVYLGGRKPVTDVLMQEASPLAMQVDRYTLASPLRLVQARFRTYWWRQLNSGLLSSQEAGQQLVKLRVMTPEEWEQVRDIAKPLLMPKKKDVPLKDTPPPDVPGMHRALTERLTDFSLRYFLAHLDEMPLPSSAREWFRLAPFCPLEPEAPEGRAQRINPLRDADRLTSLHNRVSARELRELVPAVDELRRAEREGLLVGHPLVAGLRNAVGLNRGLNMEQAWCTQEAGAGAMMALSPAFWKLMEQPMEGWKVMEPSEREALRAHIEVVCRAETVPETLEAEARGESPDYVLCALRNLQEVLAEYPTLRRYGLVMKDGQPFARRLQPEVLSEEHSPFAEPGEGPTPAYTGGSMRPGFSLSAESRLPKSLREDLRVVPALQLLQHLRRYPASRPYVLREGIQWKGKLYGGPRGQYLQGLERGWVAETPLRDMVSLLRRIGEQQSALPEGQQLNPLVSELPALGDEMDTAAPLRHVTLYRYLSNPARLCRLMPGEPEAANPAAQNPYVVQSIAGAYLGGSRAIRKAEDAGRSYTPLESFRPYRSRMGTENTRKSFNRAAVDYTLSGMLSEAVRRGAESDPRSGMAGLRELLLRFAEDSGFSLSLMGKEPHELSAGQIHALRLGRELLLCICGREPEAAYNRFLKLGESIRSRVDDYESLRRALLSAADTVYAMGEPLFTEAGNSLRRRKKTSKRSAKRGLLTAEEKKNLQEWFRENADVEVTDFSGQQYSKRYPRKPSDD